MNSKWYISASEKPSHIHRLYLQDQDSFLSKFVSIGQLTATVFDEIIYNV